MSEKRKLIAAKISRFTVIQSFCLEEYPAHVEWIPITVEQQSL